MNRFGTSKLRAFVPSLETEASNDANVFRRQMNVLMAMSVIGGACFIGLFVWYGLWHLVGTTVGYVIVSLACHVFYRTTGRAALSREIFLTTLYVYLIEMTVFYGVLRTSGSVWLVCVPVVAILLGSPRSGLFWSGATMASIIAAKSFIGGSQGMAYLTDSEADWLFSASLVMEIACLGIFVGLVDYERKLAMRGLARANETVRRLALSDPLTGVFNRRHLSDVIALDDAKPASARSIGAVLMIDIDRFKSINDTYGHMTGDDVIRSVADAIAAEAGADNPVGRFGGEEFVCLIRQTDDPQHGGTAQDLAEAIRRRVSRSRSNSPAAPKQVTVSIGLAECEDGGAAQAALARADAALYAAKAAGRNCVRIAEAPDQETIRLLRSA